MIWWNFSCIKNYHLYDICGRVTVFADVQMSDRKIYISCAVSNTIINSPKHIVSVTFLIRYHAYQFQNVFLNFTQENEIVLCQFFTLFFRWYTSLIETKQYSRKKSLWFCGFWFFFMEKLNWCLDACSKTKLKKKYMVQIVNRMIAYELLPLLSIIKYLKFREELTIWMRNPTFFG